MWHAFQLSDSFSGSYYFYHHLCCKTGGLVRVKGLLCKLLYKYLAENEVPGEKGITDVTITLSAPSALQWNSRETPLQANSGVHEEKGNVTAGQS